MRIPDFLLYTTPFLLLSWVIFKAHLHICTIRGKDPYNIDKDKQKTTKKSYWEGIYAPKDT